MRRRWLVPVPLLCAVLGLSAQPAAAGGSTWSTDAGHYAPGDTALIWAAVSWGHNPDLGDPTDGPYGVWLSGPGAQEDHSTVPPGAVYVGDIELDAIDVNVGPHVASLEFTVPDLPDGSYDIVHCDWPCTTQLGDITFGELVVDRDRALPAPPTTTSSIPPPPTTTAAPTTTVPPTTASAPTTTVELDGVAIADRDDGASSSGLPLTLTVIGLLTLVAGGLVLRSRRPTDPNEVPT